MPKITPGRVLAEDVRTHMDQFVDIDARYLRLMDERKRAASGILRLVTALRQIVGRGQAARLLTEHGLTDEALALLPQSPGRKPGAAKATPVPTKAPTPAEPGAIPKDTVITMLTGLYAGWKGRIRWMRKLANGRMVYTATLDGPRGQKARTQVMTSSLGRKWQMDGATGTGPAPKVRKARAK